MTRLLETRFTLAVLAYFGAQLVLRLLIGPSLELDEAEAFYWSRELAWGYGPQPPLYFWIQWGLFQLLGEGLFALALLKAAILSGTVIGVFLLLRREAEDGAAAVAALSLSLVPQMVWEGQRALTHSMLALLLAVVTAGLVRRALVLGRWTDYLAVGVAVGLGLLSKFNFALWPAGLLFAVLLLPDWRRLFRPVKAAVAVGVAALVVAPPALWMWRNPDLATGSVEKLRIEEAGGIAARAAGTLDILSAAVGFLALAALVLGWAWLGRGPGRAVAPPTARLLGAAALLSLVPLWGIVMATGTVEVRSRWLLPSLWALVPAVAVMIWPQLTGRGRRALAGVTGGIWLLALAALPYASLVDPGYRSAEFGPLAARLEELGGAGRALVLDDQWVAGNLSFQAPQLAPKLRGAGEEVGPGALLVLRDDLADGEGVTLEAGEPVAIQRGGRTVRLRIVEVSGP